MGSAKTRGDQLEGVGEAASGPNERGARARTVYLRLLGGERFRREDWSLSSLRRPPRPMSTAYSSYFTAYTVLVAFVGVPRP